jgi:hypothetical protein
LYRNFVATQVIKVSGSVYEKYSSKQEAIDAFEEAIKDRLVETL